MPTRLKVRGIESEGAARLAVRLGSSALGLVSSMKSDHGTANVPLLAGGGTPPRGTM